MKYETFEEIHKNPFLRNEFETVLKAEKVFFFSVLKWEQEEFIR